MPATLSPATIIQLELWSKATLQLFSQLRHATGIPDDQLNYWADPWLTWETQADHEIQQGQIAQFRTMDDLLASLD